MNHHSTSFKEIILKLISFKSIDQKLRQSTSNHRKSKQPKSLFYVTDITITSYRHQSLVYKLQIYLYVCMYRLFGLPYTHSKLISFKFADQKLKQPKKNVEFEFFNSTCQGLQPY